MTKILYSGVGIEINGTKCRIFQPHSPKDPTHDKMILALCGMVAEEVEWEHGSYEDREGILADKLTNDPYTALFLERESDIQEGIVN